MFKMPAAWTMPTAWNQGCDAHDAGLPRHDNPYPQDTDAWADWDDGWVAGNRSEAQPV